ncbi:hypothetical protein NG799_02190 [Laspinema sp. D1]|uniref:Uncharacterized protein n=2 Tax=Laspinema TaxID=2584823 RepID=A0ABT2MKA1_9CYAN|nr:MULTISPECIES: hypothetical protein [unclassified Laspinema]MCT7965143.1 hypothetical protein [Laspinema sp. D2a]MCT7977554.1 hypothetical protein [Laspinema sp. D3b]MCT7992393.1 hypothetical protein [Laspinema sp. D3c]
MKRNRSTGEMQLKKTSFNISPETKRKIEVISALEQTSQSLVLANIVDFYLTNQENLFDGLVS